MERTICSQARATCAAGIATPVSAKITLVQVLNHVRKASDAQLLGLGIFQRLHLFGLVSWPCKSGSQCSEASYEDGQDDVV